MVWFLLKEIRSNWQIEDGKRGGQNYGVESIGETWEGRRIPKAAGRTIDN